MPVLSIVPPEFSCTLQATDVFVVPVTLAAKNCVAPCDKVMELGVTATLMLDEGVGVGVGVGVGTCGGSEPPPQPQTPITAAIAKAIALGWNLAFGNNLVRPIVRGHCMISFFGAPHGELA